jgi:hypothetical protein
MRNLAIASGFGPPGPTLEELREEDAWKGFHKGLLQRNSASLDRVLFVVESLFLEAQGLDTSGRRDVMFFGAQPCKYVTDTKIFDHYRNFMMNLTRGASPEQDYTTEARTISDIRRCLNSMKTNTEFLLSRQDRTLTTNFLDYLNRPPYEF